jgi:hypothetical protein
VFVTHGTTKFRDRVPPTEAAPEEPTTTVVGDWYATRAVLATAGRALRQRADTAAGPDAVRPPVSTLEWFRVAAADVLSAHGVRRSFVDREPAETPCSPLYGTQVSPDRALAAIAR